MQAKTSPGTRRHTARHPVTVHWARTMLGVSAPSESLKPQPANSDRSERRRKPTGQGPAVFSVRDREQQNRGTGQSGTKRPSLAPTVHFQTTADPFCMFLTVNLKCSRYFSQCLLFLKTRKIAFFFLLATSFYHHNFLFHKRTERIRTGTAQSRVLDPATALQSQQGVPWRCPHGHLEDDSLLRIQPRVCFQPFPEPEPRLCPKERPQGSGGSYTPASATATRPM